MPDFKRMLFGTLAVTGVVVALAGTSITTQAQSAPTPSPSPTGSAMPGATPAGSPAPSTAPT